MFGWSDAQREEGTYTKKSKAYRYKEREREREKSPHRNHIHMHAVREFTSIESIYAHPNHNKTLGPTLNELRRQRVPQQKSCQTFFHLLHSLVWVLPFFFTSELDLFYEIPSAGGGKHDHFKFRLFVGGAPPSERSSTQPEEDPCE
jgi:hypothetical protein